MVCLALHRAETTDLPKELWALRLDISSGVTRRYGTYPACHLPVLFGTTGIRDLVVLVIPFHKILQDGTTFPDLEFVSMLVCVDDGWDATVWVDVEKPLLFLFMFEQFDCTSLNIDYVRSRHDYFEIWVHALYFKPSSSSAMEILSGLGVPSQ